MLVVAVAALAGALLGPGVAWAGGPTSALLVSPEKEHAVGLYYSDEAYGRLTDLLGPDPATDAGPAPDIGSAGYVTVTWLIHDVTIWRIDRVFHDPDGAPWVVTSVDMGGTGVSLSDFGPGAQGGENPPWHRPADPGALTALLTDLGLLGAPGAEAVSGGADAGGVVPATGTGGSPIVDTAAAPAGDGPPPAPGPTTGDSPWWWAGAGALLGAAAAVLGVRNSAQLRRRLVPVPAPHA